MAKCKGKFLNFIGGLMGLYKEEKAKADEAIYAKTGKYFGEFETEEFYDTKMIKLALEAYANASPTGRKAIVTMGRNVYPLMDRTIGLPRELMKTPLDAIKFEAEGFLMEHQNDGGTPVIPRKFHLFEEGHVIVEAPMPDYDSILNVGVYLGLLKMIGITTVKVERIDDEKSIFDITW